ncbi:ABC transporter substrate-binding protein [Methylosinus sp. Sm6]|uniref:ABC transporter substrate-binding protein n=1 Tax=Methylosinus sp. Sm6 TaxID=2866948 RepID=UPI001C995128|nr:ABC transporter substrate-binding protein [Methylosinus sp. Sm6]MBY6240513.1 ABC transporter substrate-binding protein [Methylosinus sp. Sm6]
MTSKREAKSARAVAAALVALACGGAASAAAGGAPSRIVSLNACADQYLIALADKQQIAALTHFSRDPSLSFYAEAAKAYPISKGEAEAALALRPSLVITNPYRRADDLALLQGKVAILSLKPANSFDDVIEETRRIAAAIGQRERGEALIRSMQQRVAAAGRRPIGGVAAHYQRGGYLTGPGTLMDDLMSRAGLDNLARRLNGGTIGRLSLEEIIYRRPDYLVLSNPGGEGQDQGELVLEHPALMRAVPADRRLRVPAALTVCGGPSYPDALERLQAEAARAMGR